MLYAWWHKMTQVNSVLRNPHNVTISLKYLLRPHFLRSDSHSRRPSLWPECARCQRLIYGTIGTRVDNQPISVLRESDPLYCIELPVLKEASEEDGAFVLLSWINVIIQGDTQRRFGSTHTMQIARETSFQDLQKLILKEMASLVHHSVLCNKQEVRLFAFCGRFWNFSCVFLLTFLSTWSGYLERSSQIFHQYFVDFTRLFSFINEFLDSIQFIHIHLVNIQK